VLEAGAAAAGLQDAWQRLDGSERHDEEVGGAGRPAQGVQDPFERRLVGPVQVVEDQGQRGGPGKLLEEVAQGAVQPEALGRRHRRRARPCDGRQHLGELGGQGGDAGGVQHPDGVVERVHGQAEGDVALLLGGAAAQHEQARVGRGGEERLEQGRLADPRLARDGDEARRARRDVGHGGPEGRELRLAADEVEGTGHGHAWCQAGGSRCAARGVRRGSSPCSARPSTRNIGASDHRPKGAPSWRPQDRSSRTP
jgi:hypothetical protein